MRYSFSKYQHYFDAYDRELRNVAVERVLEIGMQCGGVLYHWHDLYPLAQITGVDIDPACINAVDEYKIHVMIGDSSSNRFLKKVADRGPFDVVVDDGGHWPFMHEAAFESLWPHLTVGGVYVIEDLECAFHWRWLWDKGTLRALDDMAWEQTRRPTDVERISRYRNIAFIHKGPVFEPKVVQIGEGDCRGGKGIKGSTAWAMLKGWFR